MNITGQTTGIETYAAAARTLRQDSTMDDEVRAYATEIVVDVLYGDITVHELRGGVRWANALDREATQYADTFSAVEQTARRITHHAGRMALGHVKTESRRVRWLALTAWASTMAQRQVLEEHDETIRAQHIKNLVQYM